jgi:hypothetical protein
MKDPNKWVNNAITTLPKTQALESWWLTAKTREEFTAKLQDELPRMAVSKFGSATRLMGD